MEKDGFEIEFREIPWAPGYRVGTDGSIWSRRKPSASGGMYDDWKQLKPGVNRGGYHQVVLMIDKKISRQSVHLLVLSVFVEPRPPGMQVRHLDGNPRNNHLSNLKWGTAKENASDKIGHGTAPIGSNHPRAMLCDDTVKVIRKLAFAGVPSRVIAFALDMKEATIGWIASGYGWKHIEIEKNEELKDLMVSRKYAMIQHLAKLELQRKI